MAMQRRCRRSDDEVEMVNGWLPDMPSACANHCIGAVGGGCLAILKSRCFPGVRRRPFRSSVCSLALPRAVVGISKHSHGILEQTAASCECKPCVGLVACNGNIAVLLEAIPVFRATLYCIINSRLRAGSGWCCDTSEYCMILAGCAGWPGQQLQDQLPQLACKICSGFLTFSLPNNACLL